MARDAQFETLLDLLRAFEREGVLRHLMLIGSWCLFFYRSALPNAEELPTVRTLDADFLIPRPRGLARDVDVPALLTAAGFVPTFHRASQWVVYDHPELRVEFLTPELGRGSDHADAVKTWHVTAQRLRYLQLLGEHPRRIVYRGVPLCVPEPAAYALHKLIVSARRAADAKRRKDLEAAVAVLDYIYAHPVELVAMRTVLRRVPKGWLKTLAGLTEKHYPALTEEIRAAQDV